MVRNVTKIIQCGHPGSGCVSRRGAGIKEIMKRTVEISENIKDDGYLIVQGGGNSLKWLGVKETVSSILEGLEETQRVNKNVCVAICSILPRPRESQRYEQMRCEVNRKLQEESCGNEGEGRCSIFSRYGQRHGPTHVPRRWGAL